jgi:hypothetical protein
LATIYEISLYNRMPFHLTDLLLLACALVSCTHGHSALPPVDPHHDGTPAGISPTYNCAARIAAYHYGQSLLPSRGTFKSLFEALQLQASLFI